MYTSYLAAISRFPFVMARDNMFFKIFNQVSPKYGTPVVAIVACSLLNILLSTQSFGTLLVMSMSLYFLPIILILVSVLVLRYTKPDVKRYYKIPGGTPVLSFFIIVPSLLVGIAFWNMTDTEFYSGMAGLATGPVAYLFFKWLYGGQPKNKSESEED